MSQGGNVTLRLTADQRAAWEAAAAAEGVKVGTWVKRTCEAALASEKPAQARTRTVTRQPAARACPRSRHHRPGVFCKTCGETP